jgi:MoxR-like ATPase
MQERSVSFAGTTYELEAPFFVLATQNPIELAGTYPLPEAQLDRFLLHVRIEYPGEADEQEIMLRTTGEPEPALAPVLGREELLELCRLVRQVSITDGLLGYVTRLVRASRPGTSPVPAVRDWVRWGAGPRAGQALILAAKARALMQGRCGVTREDLRTLALPVLRHRILLNFQAEAEGRRVGEIVTTLLQTVPAPGEP